jgi:hypothetical protein
MTTPHKRNVLVGYLGTEHAGSGVELIHHLAPHHEMQGFHYLKAPSPAAALSILTPSEQAEQTHFDLLVLPPQFVIPHVLDIETAARADRKNLLDDIKRVCQGWGIANLDALTLGTYAMYNLKHPNHLIITAPQFLMTPPGAKDASQPDFQRFPLLRYELMGAKVIHQAREYKSQAEAIAKRAGELYPKH